MDRNQVYVITGATSFIASGLLRKLVIEAKKIYAICRPNSMQLERLPKNKKIEVIFEELEGLGTLSQKIQEKCDVFFHLGWSTSEKNDMYLQNLNVKYTLDSVLLAKTLGCHTFIGVGSQAEYGLANVKLTERTSTYPVTGYGMAKLCAGQMSRVLCEQKGIKHIWTRIVSVYGPMDASSTLVSYVVKKLQCKEVVRLTKGEQIWDYLYIDDCAQALYLLGEKGKHGEIYNVASGDEIRLRDYIQTIRAVVAPDGDVEFGAIAYNTTTPMYLSADISKINIETGFFPKTDFRSGIEKTLQHSINKR